MLGSMFRLGDSLNPEPPPNPPSRCGKLEARSPKPLTHKREFGSEPKWEQSRGFGVVGALGFRVIP